MMRVLVWGAPDLPDTHGDHQGVDPVKVRNRRLMSAAIAAATVLTIAALTVPAALGATKYELQFVAQPVDAEAGANITSAHFVDGSSFVQVKLVDGSGNLVTNSKALVTFTLATGPGLASGTIDVVPQLLVNGVATFGAGTLKILDVNEPQFTSYQLIPITTKNPIVTGPASVGFDIWEVGDTCGSGETCEAQLRGDAPGGGADTYSLFTPGTLGASELPQDVLPGLSCPGQRTVFADSVFVNATTDSTTPDTPGPVFLSSHITQADFRAAGPSFGQAHVEWCVGLKDPGPWNFTQQDTNGDDILDLYVGLAPKCPSQSPELSAPCIVSTTSDGAGGSISLGWLPGGDPPRRT
jgi:hypothetical protein